jgi:hypothetical protein
LIERKPPGISHEDWIERQIREARERGAFDHLRGMGKPIANLGRPFTAQTWALDYIQREGGDLAALLPPMLALRKERAAILASLADLPYENVVRVTVEDFNHRLLDQYRRPMDGPLIAVGVLDMDDTLAAWRTARPAGRAEREPEPEAEPSPAPPPKRRWWQRRRRRTEGPLSCWKP